MLIQPFNTLMTDGPNESRLKPGDKKFTFNNSSDTPLLTGVYTYDGNSLVPESAARVSQLNDNYISSLKNGADPLSSNNDDGGTEDYFLDRLESIIGNYQQMAETSMNSYLTSAINAQIKQADIANAFSRIEAEKARSYNSAEADIARRWQANREDTAYQRLVSDLRKAGLNPMLAYQSANPSTGSAQVASSSPSPSGQQANISSAKNADKISTSDFLPMLILPVVSSALQIVSDISASLRGSKSLFSPSFDFHLF